MYAVAIEYIVSFHESFFYVNPHILFCLICVKKKEKRNVFVSNQTELIKTLFSVSA